MTIDAWHRGPIEVKPRRWYKLIDVPSHSRLSEGEAAEEFRALLKESVRMHMRSDVQVGSCLSGGLDSSSIVCLMADQLLSGSGDSKVQTVSACYAEKSVDEKPFMDLVVAATGAEPHFVFPDAANVFERSSDIIWHQDEPFGSTSIFAQWCVFEMARSAGIKVMLDGQGADEQLAGYHASFPVYMAALLRDGRRAMALRTIIERKYMHGIPLTDQVASFVLPHLPARLANALSTKRSEAVQHDWLGSDLMREHRDPRGAFGLALAALDLKPATDIATLCAGITYASNLQLLLHWEDRNSMAHAIEARVPFLDHRLVEFSLRLGNDHKIVGGDTKRVLRRAMKGILPERVRQRRDKLGFSTPEETWFRGPLRGAIIDGIEATLRAYPGLLNTVGVRAFAADMLEGRRPVDFTLWRIASLSLWNSQVGAHL